jgi:hypothetical protein
VGGDAVEERELEYAEPERREHGGLELLDRPAGELGDHVVERCASLYCAVCKPRCKRAVTRVEILAAGFAVKRAVGVGAVLEDAPDHRICACARGRCARPLVRCAATAGIIVRGPGRVLGSRATGFLLFVLSHFAGISRRF